MANRKNHERVLWLLALHILILATTVSAQDAAYESQPPNILLLVADDLGYADLGIHGSKIRTPNIDKLAAQGVHFSQFYTGSSCAPTRAMLLSGNNNHVAGMAHQFSPTILSEQPGYEGHLSDRVVPFPRLLQQAGYRTYMAGKWHLGDEAENDPGAAGFDQYFALLQGSASHFDGRGVENRPSLYRENGDLTDWPDGAYSTEFYTDKIISYLDSGDSRPFFVYAAYTSPHWPLQVPEADRNLYAGVFDAGYEQLREQNFQAMLANGMLPPDLLLRPANPDVALWESLSPDQQRREARKMELYAAMVENLDRHIGRLLQHLEDSGQLHNTLVVFMGDNGADGNDLYQQSAFAQYLQQNYANEFDDWGGPDSFVAYGAPWAEASSAPFWLYKTFATEGGLLAPLIISGPGVMASDNVSHAWVTVMDLAPTFLQLAGGVYPEKLGVEPMLGESLIPLLGGQIDQVRDETSGMLLFHRNQAMYRQGDWKITAVGVPFMESRFSLFNIKEDPGETMDLSQEFPEIKQRLLRLWREERAELGVLLPQDL